MTDAIGVGHGGQTVGVGHGGQTTATSPRAGPGLLAAPDKVLATLERDGRRRWLRPRSSPGKFLAGRRAVGYALMALYLVLPHLRIGGRPPILLDLPAREFTLLGVVFGPTETPYLMLLMLSIFVGVFLVTALAGRAWCGWGCPQTVYLELLFRPLERLLEGSPQEQRVLDAAGPSRRRVLKNGLFLLIAFVLANTFLAYFVGTDRLWTWMRGSPLVHPTAFLVMAATTALVFLDFAWFREQTCLVACPYGRFQSALLDRQSLIVGYDRARGEPRGKPGRRLPEAAAPVTVATPAVATETVATETVATEAVATAARGDCVDCGACVVTCPTGIDIRDGLQMECIGCAQCVDACDSIMDRVGHPRGLIRYASQAELASPPEPRRILRPRVVAYALVLAGLLGTLAALLAGREAAEVTLLRPTGAPFVVKGDEVRSQVHVKVENRGDASGEYRIGLETPQGAPVEGLSLVTARNPVVAAPGETVEAVVFVIAPRARYAAGPLRLVVTVEDGRGFRAALPATLLGPAGGAQ